jgi:predicted esterase
MEDLKRRTDELANFVVGATERYHIAAGKMVAVGYSNGANIAASILLRRPGLLQRAVLFRAMVPLVPDELPDLSGTRVWIAGGKDDGLIPPAETEGLADLLRAAGADVTLRLIDADHGLTSSEFVLAKRWLEGA